MPILWFIAFFYDKRRARLEAERVEAAQARRRQAAPVAISASPQTATSNRLPLPGDGHVHPPVSPSGKSTKSAKRESGSGGYNWLEEH